MKGMKKKKTLIYNINKTCGRMHKYQLNLRNASYYKNYVMSTRINYTTYILKITFKMPYLT